MFKKRFVLLAVLAASCTATVYGQTADSKFLGTRWDKPGPKKAVKSPPLGGTFGPGEANWSIVGAGIGIAGGDAHPGVTRKFDALLPNDPAGTAEALFQAALKTWADASVTPGNPGSGFKLLGKVADGGGLVGQGPPDPANMINTDGTVGDIRAAVFPFEEQLQSQGNPFDVIAHAFYPDTDAQKVFYAAFASIGGDAHFRPHAFGLDGMPNTFDDEPTGVKWIDWQPGDPMAIPPIPPDPAPAFDEIDLYTVMLHEVGHALGLGHNLVPDPANMGQFIPADNNSVMVPTYPGIRQMLSATDIANIRQLYRAVPEPSTIGLAIVGCVTMGLMARRRRRSAC
jgi:Matrixin/PEP-CTERM motif